MASCSLSEFLAVCVQRRLRCRSRVSFSLLPFSVLGGLLFGRFAAATENRCEQQYQKSAVMHPAIARRCNHAHSIVTQRFSHRLSTQLRR